MMCFSFHLSHDPFAISLDSHRLDFPISINVATPRGQCDLRTWGKRATQAPFDCEVDVIKT